MKSKIKIGFIGVGRRGSYLLTGCFCKMPDVEVVAVCDNCSEHLEIMREKFQSVNTKTVFTENADDIFNKKDIDAVIIATGWHEHIPLAKKSMKAGKYTAIEVGGAFDISECFELVNIYEETGAPLMMLENCCYGRREMMALNLVKKGLFGEIVHCSGGYLHNLPECELFKDFIEGVEDNVRYKHYRLDSYIHRNCEQYPTHELGPISKVLNINRGNRFVSLSSFATKARGMKQCAKDLLGEDSEFSSIDYKQGDIITTILTCANGETVQITLDTILPRPYYSRGFTVRGTKGMCSEERKSVLLEGMKEPVENNEEEMFKQYDHPLWKENINSNNTSGHGGMDWLVCRAFIESVKNGTDTPLNIYDTVTLLAVTPLSEMSINGGGIPIPFPDFTRGQWVKKSEGNSGKYSLDNIIDDSATPIFVQN